MAATMSHGAARASLIADLTKSVNFDFDLTAYAGEYHWYGVCGQQTFLD